MKLEIEVVVWDDAFSMRAPESIEEIITDGKKGFPVVSAGIIVYEDKHRVVLARSYHRLTEKYDDVLYIPKSLIRERKSISVNIKEEK